MSREVSHNEITPRTEFRKTIYLTTQKRRGTIQSMTLPQNLKSYLKTSKKPLIVILGPTASGKTALSLKIAKEFNGEIISTDSRQIYKGLEIGSEAIPKDQRQNIPHHMIGIVTPDKELTLAEYKDIAEEKIEEIRKKGKIPILVGGTGLYISALIENYDVPRIPPDKKLREKLYKEAEKHGPAHIHEKLQKLDPNAAKKIHPNNLRYVIRAIEINLKSGKNKNPTKAPPKTTHPTPPFLIGTTLPREILYERINKRIDDQIERGVIDEVKAAIKKYGEKDLPALSSIGLKEYIPYIKNEKTLEECKEILKKNTRNYAKRQMTWFRRYKNIEWITPKI